LAGEPGGTAGAGGRGTTPALGARRVNCPKCGSEAHRVIETRHDDHSGTRYADMIRRRRECRVCGWRWNTFEEWEVEVWACLENKKAPAK
jgi:transcriptional regulator NrdR family protein